MATANSTARVRRLKVVEKFEPHPYDFLSFTQPLEPDGRDFWNVPITGDHSMDCVLGGALAREAEACMRRYGHPDLLKDVVFGMIRKGRVSGAEIGFMLHFVTLLAPGLGLPAT